MIYVISSNAERSKFSCLVKINTLYTQDCSPKGDTTTITPEGNAPAAATPEYISNKTDHSSSIETPTPNKHLGGSSIQDRLAALGVSKFSKSSLW